MKLNLPEEERAYAECLTCSWGCSGSSSRVDDKADQHEYDNPGHVVRIAESQ
jgi:hypothetical protein